MIRTPAQRAVLIVLFAVVHIFVASQVYLLSKDILYGDGSAEELRIEPRYPLMRVPETFITSQYDAAGRLCADFAQIYFPAQNISALKDAYAISTTLDPWSRESKYPPLLHFICASTLCKLSYGPASLLHLAFQTFLFLASFAFAFVELKLRKFFLPSLLLVNVCLFLTPVGLSSYERGQLSLYVATCYLWLMLALMTGRKKYAFISAVFAFLKWTSFPFIFIVLAVHLLNARNMAEFRERLMVPLIFGGTTLTLFCLLPRDGLYFLNAIETQELTYVPMGISLVALLPRYIVKALPFSLIAVGAANRLTLKNKAPYLLPFFTGSATILLTYPTFAFDYSVPCLLAFLPLIVYWAKLPGVDKVTGNIVQTSFFLFLLAASFSIILFDSDRIVTLVYAIMSLALAITPFLIKANISAETRS